MRLAAALAASVGLAAPALAEKACFISYSGFEEKVAHLDAGHGLNAATGEYVDLIAAGIIDPAKVTRSALQNAASIAALFLTTEAVVADKPEKAAAAMPGGDDMGGMGGMGF